MAFSISTYDLPRLQGYNAALAYYNKAKPWRGQPDNERPLANRAAKYKRIILRPNGDIACRLHNTDVVTYHPDNTITLRPYASISTDAFANALLPWGIRTYFNTGHYYLVQAGEKLYALSSTGAIFSLDTLKPITPTLLFIHRQLDKKKATAALKQYRYAAFKAYVEMYARMWKPTNTNGWYPHTQSIAHNLMNDRWDECVYRSALAGVDVGVTLDAVREAIYKAGDAIITTEKLSLSSWTDYKAVVRGEKYA